MVSGPPSCSRAGRLRRRGCLNRHRRRLVISPPPRSPPPLPHPPLGHRDRHPLGRRGRRRDCHGRRRLGPAHRGHPGRHHLGCHAAAAAAVIAAAGAAAATTTTRPATARTRACHRAPLPPGLLPPAPLPPLLVLPPEPMALLAPPTLPPLSARTSDAAGAEAKRIFRLVQSDRSAPGMFWPGRSIARAAGCRADSGRASATRTGFNDGLGGLLRLTDPCAASGAPSAAGGAGSATTAGITSTGLSAGLAATQCGSLLAPRRGRVPLAAGSRRPGECYFGAAATARSSGPGSLPDGSGLAASRVLSRPSTAADGSSRPPPRQRTNGLAPGGSGGSARRGDRRRRAPPQAPAPPAPATRQCRPAYSRAEAASRASGQPPPGGTVQAEIDCRSRDMPSRLRRHICHIPDRSVRPPKFCA